MWLGGRADESLNEWFWWSNNVKTDIDWSALAMTQFDLSTGDCVVLSGLDLQIGNTECYTLRPFLCQRDIAFHIPDSDWFLVNGRKMAHVSKETTWEVAMVNLQYTDSAVYTQHISVYKSTWYFAGV